MVCKKNEKVQIDNERKIERESKKTDKVISASASAIEKQIREFTYSCMAAILSLSESKDKSGKTGIGGALILFIFVSFCFYNVKG
jgi:hypothetical protein